jgi:MerR family redox-sensitive transcriptional activator SoxR
MGERELGADSVIHVGDGMTSTMVEVKGVAWQAVRMALAPGAKELTVGQLAARSGVSVSALHFYERQHLITSRRTSGNQRRYSRDTLRRVAFIRVAHRVGIPLAEIAGHLALLPGNKAPTRRDWERISKAWRADLDERIHRLEQLRDDFTGCIGCGCLSIDRCSLANPRDTLGSKGAGPRRLEETQIS